ncbi:MAG: hypothetical protein HQL27_02490 [Candidatus Omnitrophica bacterium]|nr:hypothetical protein [Candidatus Omnitrophota bacterium]
MYWVPFLHIYQPPTQSESILRQVAEECYRPLVRLLKENTNARITLNISACLTEQLARCGYSDIIDGFGKLAHEGKVEFTGSAKYHPILPLIPPEEIKRQIDLNHKTNSSYFRGVYQPRGFFPPEMCYSREVAKVVRNMGFEWILADEIAYGGKLGAYRNDRLYRIGSTFPLKVFFKEREISSAIAYGRCRTKREFMRLLNPCINLRDRYLLTGNDGEIYGHHHRGQEKLLVEIFNDKQIKTCTISQLNNIFPQERCVEPVASSWSVWEDELKMGIPYPQWHDPENKIHQYQWELARLAIDAVNKIQEKQKNTEFLPQARQFLDEGLHSCQWWWASCRPWWSMQMIVQGANMLTLAITSLKKCGIAASSVNNAYKLQKKIMKSTLEWETSGRIKTLQSEYLTNHREVNSLLSFN